VTDETGVEAPHGAHAYVGGAALEDDYYEAADDDVFDEWTVRSEEIGHASVPVLLEIGERLPSMDAAMLCTADGFNLCAVGVDEEQVGRLAALSSSLYSVSGATAGALDSGRSEPLDVVSLVSQSRQLIVISLAHQTLGYLLLVVSAKDVRLGEMLVVARGAARQITGLLNSLS
jgi:predicted regulator of Ras-like GTPase activity (Roadblock/LC7/MglB family)